MEHFYLLSKSCHFFNPHFICDIFKEGHMIRSQIVLGSFRDL